MQTSTTDPAVRCHALTKRYGDLVALDRVDLEVQRGECLGLLGPNGAGKTTAVEIMEGLRTPDDGVVEVLGLQWGRQQRQLR
jgi:ABC-2 type transport system ATP-binding protein